MEVQHPPSGGIYDETTLNWNIFRLDDDAMEQVGDDCYQHHIFTENRKLTNPGDLLMVMHFFVEPELIEFKPYKPMNNSSDSFRGFVAYLLLEDQFWATDVFGTFEEFSMVYKVKI